MSKIKPQSPIVHTPGFKEYEISAAALRNELYQNGLSLPLGMLDWKYYHTDHEGWGKVLRDLVFKSSLYKPDRFDCENYALKAMNLCAERYGLNTLGFVIGEMPLGRHGFNIFWDGDRLWLWEPNAGFSCAGEPFAIGENDYIPVEVLV